MQHLMATDSARYPDRVFGPNEVEYQVIQALGQPEDELQPHHTILPPFSAAEE